METIYLGLGTNLGDRISNLLRAIEALGAKIIITDVSRIYATDAWGIEDQPDFLNMCVAGQTELSPFALLQFVKHLETKLGRIPTTHWGPRLIDIDILFYDDLVLDEPGLTIPHRGAAERATVLVPLADIAPNLQHPIEEKSISELRSSVDSAGVRLYKR